MELVERSEHLDVLLSRYRSMDDGGHTVFLVGEAGVGKTSLVTHFLKTIERPVRICTGACDSLFTPRPLGPLYDVAEQIGPHFLDLLRSEKDRAVIFISFIQELMTSKTPVILFFEDIHWADEATVDFIKFMARRITKVKCLFVLTFREDEVHPSHPLKNLFSQLAPGTFSKLTVSRLSREAVHEMAMASGHASGEQLYLLTDGNPFYVTEILASCGQGIPDRVKDSILTSFYSRDEEMRAFWEMLSILPSRIEFVVMEQIAREFRDGIVEECIRSGVIVNRQDYLSFKHELYRLTIEESISLYRKRSLHARVLKIMMGSPDTPHNLSTLVHHARLADDRALVASLAPRAAREAAAVGAHIEASKLYQTAIEYTHKSDSVLVELYELHAYECYLTNQIVPAIASQERAVEIWKHRKVRLKEGDTIRFLSRLLWFQGQCARVEQLALEAVDVLENGFPTRERALAYSNLSQLYMLSDNTVKTLSWGNKAIDLAARLEDREVLTHALTNVGCILMKFPATKEEGEEKLKQSLALAIENDLQEHAARVYTKLIFLFTLHKEYDKARHILAEGWKYCEERNLDSWMYYILSEKIQLLFETGQWTEAENIAQALHDNPYNSLIVRIAAIATLARLKIRRGEFDEAKRLLDEGMPMANLTGEAQRTVPILAAQLELCWIKGFPPPVEEIRQAEPELFHDKNNSWHYTELAYWMRKCGAPVPDDISYLGPFRSEYAGDWMTASREWKEAGCLYEHALALFEGDEEHQKQSLVILTEIGATATYEMLRSKLRSRGIKNIPRGPRESTRKNPALLTGRQVEVLELLQESLQNNEIASKLFISQKTVDHHISAILSKLEVSSRAKAVKEARKLGILKS